MRKILPYIDDEYEFLSRLKYMIKDSDIAHIRINLYIDSLMSGCSCLSDEGFESIYSEFKEEIDEELRQLYEELLKASDWGFSLILHFETSLPFQTSPEPFYLPLQDSLKGIYRFYSIPDTGLVKDRPAFPGGGRYCSSPYSHQ